MDERASRVAERFEWPVLVAAALVVPTMALEASSVGEPWHVIGEALNWAIWTVFLVELVVMLAIVPRRLEWLRGHLVEVAIVVLTPPFLPASLQVTRVLRLLRLVRLLPMMSVARRVFSLDGLRYAALLAFLTAVGGGTAFASVEKHLSTWDGVWWAMTTMTTVGYGDIYPHTNAGRVIAVVVMVVGIGFLTMAIGAVAERFVAAEVETEIERVEQIEHDAEAELLGELRAIANRIVELEDVVRRLRTAHR